MSAYYYQVVRNQEESQRIHHRSNLLLLPAVQPEIPGRSCLHFAALLPPLGPGPLAKAYTGPLTKYDLNERPLSFSCGCI